MDAPIRVRLLEDGVVDPHSERQRRLIAAASQALAAMQSGEDEGALDEVADAVRSSPHSHTDARELMLLLFGSYEFLYPLSPPPCGFSRRLRFWP